MPRFQKTQISELYKSPLIIGKIDFRSKKKGKTIINYGKKLYKSKIYYLHPRIKYKGSKSTKLTLNIKIIKPDGTLNRSKKSPKGYTYNAKLTCDQGINTASLSGWGNNSGGSYSKGYHRIEFWYKNICVGYKKFYIN